MNAWLTGAELLLGVGDLLTVYLFGYMHRHFFEKRHWAERHERFLPVIYFLDWCMLFASNLMEIPPLNLAAMISAYLLPLFVIYGVKRFRDLTGFFFYMVGTMVMEVFLGITSGYLNNEMGFRTQYDLLTPQTALLMNLMEIILVILICRFGGREKDEKSDKMILLFMAMPIVSVMLIIVDMFLLGMGWYHGFNSGQYLRTAVLLVVVNIAVFAVIEKYTAMMNHEMELVQEKAKLQSDAAMMGMAAQNMKDRLLASETVIRRDRLMRHDRRHFESLLLQLLEDGKTEEACKYLKERLALEPQTAEKYCDNTIVNAAISHYIAQAGKEEIRTEVSVHIPVSLAVDEMELSITISNLLENAIHACRKLPESERYLKLTAHYKSQLLMEIENSCSGTVPLNQDGHPFSNEKNHGVGTRSVLAFVEKTDGEIQYIASKHRFIVRMIINA